MPDDLSLLSKEEKALWDAEAKMTPGPWSADNDNFDFLWAVRAPSGHTFCGVSHHPDSGRATDDCSNEEADATGISLARNSIRPLLLELIRVRKAFECVLREGNIVKIYEIAHEALEEGKMSEPLKPMTAREFRAFHGMPLTQTVIDRIALALNRGEEAMKLLKEICERDGYEAGDGDPDDFGDRAAALLKEAKDGQD